MRRPSVLPASAALSLALASLIPARAVHAGGEDGAGAQGARGLFSWAQAAEDVGHVHVPASGPGWTPGPGNTRYRPVPSFTGDPTFEAILGPPESGHPILAERILVQMPADFAARPFEKRVLVVAFHSFSVSEKEVFLSTELPHECARRGWMLVAPYGLKDTHYANVNSQRSLESVARVLYQFVPFNYRRVYAVGFSMGALSALSFGMRHLDPGELRFAGIVAHTPPLDVAALFESASPQFQATLSNAGHFGAPPSVDPFAYERVSPAFLAPGGLDPQLVPAANLAHVPLFLHTNLADPQQGLVVGTQQLADLLRLFGAEVVESFVYEPGLGHAWATLPLARALDVVATGRLEGNGPPQATVFADRTGAWHQAELREAPPLVHARWRLAIAPADAPAPNAFEVVGTRHVEELAFLPEALGLEVAHTLWVRHQSLDGTPDRLILRGYSAAPSEVVTESGAPLEWSFDPLAGEVRVVPSSDGHPVWVRVVP